MSEWYRSLGGVLDRAWQVLREGVADADHPARFVTLASLAPDGAPEARILGLRRADRNNAEIALYTDIASSKIAGLRGDPRVCVHVWEPRLQLQLRLRGTCAIASGDAARAQWESVPDASRGNYGVTPAPGSPIPRADAYERLPEATRFAVLTIALHQIDAVHLGAEPHARAVYERGDGWRGQWLAP